MENRIILKFNQHLENQFNKKKWTDHSKIQSIKKNNLSKTQPAKTNYQIELNLLIKKI